MEPLLREGPIAPLEPFGLVRSNFDAYYQDSVARGDPVIADVYVMMMRATESRRSVWNSWERWAIANHCDGYVHIELAFVDSNGHVAAWTVNRHDASKDERELGRPPRPGERVSGYVHEVYHDMSQSYDSRWWEDYHLSSLTPGERYALYVFCKRQEGKPMDKWGMYINFMPVLADLWVSKSRPEEDSYFCSQLVASALKWIRPREFADVEPRRCTPAALHKMMERNGDFFLTSSIRPVSEAML